MVGKGLEQRMCVIQTYENAFKFKLVYFYFYLFLFHRFYLYIKNIMEKHVRVGAHGATSSHF